MFATPRKSTRVKTQSGKLLESKENKKLSKINVARTPKKEYSDLSDGEEMHENIKVDVTPPKQKRYQSELKTSPGGGASSLILKLKLETPTKDSSKKLFTKYQRARKILNTTETQKLPGRENEYQELFSFLLEHADQKTSGSLYISGQPGTGKTACLTKILNDDEINLKYKKVYLNCTSVTSINNVYNDISSELKLSNIGKEAIEEYLSKNHKMVLLVLDEIDQLIGKKQSILYSIFEWPAIPKSKLVLIGIANALDLTDRMLPRLNMRCELKPKLMHFAPYTKQQIIEIFKQRLEDADVLDLFPPVTIQLLAAKVSAVSGDVRRALDIGRRVVEIAERNNKKICDNIDLSELGVSPLNDDNDEKKFNPIEMNQVVSVLNNVYGNEDIEESFPLQHKILVGSLLLILKHDKNKFVTVGRLHDVYKKICAKRNIHAVDQSEFVGVCDLVESRGIISFLRKKEPRHCRISLQWDETEINQTLQDKQLISSILNDVMCLEK